MQFARAPPHHGCLNSVATAAWHRTHAIYFLFAHPWPPRLLRVQPAQCIGQQAGRGLRFYAVREEQRWGGGTKRLIKVARSAACATSTRTDPTDLTPRSSISCLAVCGGFGWGKGGGGAGGNGVYTEGQGCIKGLASTCQLGQLAERHVGTRTERN